MAKQKFVLYAEPNFGLLENVARELGIELTTDSDIREAEKLFQQGIRPPGTEDGHTPKEIAYLSQLLGTIQEKGVLPTKLNIYMNDRGFANFPETVPTAVAREKGRAFHDLVERVGQLNQAIQRERGR